MLSMRINTVVEGLVEQLFRDRVNPSDKEALHFHLDCRMHYYARPKGHYRQDDPKEYQASRGLHLVYHRAMYFDGPSNYTSVFSAILPDPFDKIDRVVEWKHMTTHDSCWRDVSSFSEVYFAMADEINAAMEADRLEKVAPRDMDENNGFRMFGDPFSWIPVEVKMDEDDEYQHRRILTVK